GPPSARSLVRGTLRPRRSVLAPRDPILHGPGLVVQLRLRDATEELRDLAAGVDPPFAHEIGEDLARAPRQQPAQGFPCFCGELFRTWRIEEPHESQCGRGPWSFQGSNRQKPVVGRLTGRSPTVLCR